MRNKNLITTKLEKIDSRLRVLNYHIGTNNRPKAYECLDGIKELMSEITTLLNRETQD